MRFVHCLVDNMSNMLMHKNETLNTRKGEVLGTYNQAPEQMSKGLFINDVIT